MLSRWNFVSDLREAKTLLGFVVADRTFGREWLLSATMMINTIAGIRKMSNTQFGATTIAHWSVFVFVFVFLVTLTDYMG